MILGASNLQVPAILKAKEMGLSVVVLDYNPNAVGFEIEGINKEIISTIDTKNVLKAAIDYKIDGIMTIATDMPIRTISVVADKLGLPGVSIETSLCATNKFEMRSVLKKFDVPVPEFYLVSNFNDFFDVVNYFNKKNIKTIVKPSDNSGSRGVRLIDNYALTDLKNIYEYSAKYSRSGDLVIEEFMEGPEVSVETLSYNGECNVIQITDKITTGPPYFVEMGHMQPSRLQEPIKNSIIDITKRANDAIGNTLGPSHTEIIVTENGPKVVEIGARLGGDRITSDLVPLSTGVDLVGACINVSLGEPPDIKKIFSKYSIIKYLKMREGTLMSINGVEQAKKIQGVKEVHVGYPIGMKFESIKNSLNRPGYVIVQSDNLNDAIEKCDLALNMIKLEVL